MNSLGIKLSGYMAEATALKTTSIGVENARKNKERFAGYFGKTINDLLNTNQQERDKPVIVVNAGPSLYRKNSVARILAARFKGDIIVPDGSLGHCLRSGLIPNYLVVVDPHVSRIIRWFGDTQFDERQPDDFFTRRQKNVDATWADEKRCNQELIDLVNRYGSKIKVIIGTSVDTDVTQRCVESGMELYWWNPLYDDYDQPDSISRKLCEENKAPCMVTGGKVGTAAWIFAHAILKKRHVALVGEDLGYAADMPHESTQFYHELIELFGERAPETYINIANPYTGETWYADPTFYWYREIFLDMAKEAQCITYNCTEGGVLFGDNIQFIKLDEFLSKFSQGG